MWLERSYISKTTYMTHSNTSTIFPLDIQTNYYFTCLVILSIIFGACSTNMQNDRGSADVDLSTERETLMTLERTWSDLYSQGDVESIAEFLAEESVLLVPGQPPAVGRDRVLALTRELLATEATDEVSVSWKPDTAFVSSSADMAYDYGRSKTTLPDGSIIEGSYLVVWTKKDGEWKVAADIFN